MKSSLELALRPVSFNLQVRNIHVLHHEINEHSPKREICWDICLHCMLKSSLWFPRVQWQTFQIQQLCIHTPCSVILACHWWYKLFVHWWMKGIYFASFCFRVWDLTREIRENKNPAKISTYTVVYIYTFERKKCLLTLHIQVFFSKFLMGGTQIFLSPSGTDGDKIRWGGGTCEKNSTEVETAHLRQN